MCLLSFLKCLDGPDIVSFVECNGDISVQFWKFVTNNSFVASHIWLNISGLLRIKIDKMALDGHGCLIRMTKTLIGFM